MHSGWHGFPFFIPRWRMPDSHWLVPRCGSQSRRGVGRRPPSPGFRHGRAMAKQAALAAAVAGDAMGRGCTGLGVHVLLSDGRAFRQNACQASPIGLAWLPVRRHSLPFGPAYGWRRGRRVEAAFSPSRKQPCMKHAWLLQGFHPFFFMLLRAPFGNGVQPSFLACRRAVQGLRMRFLQQMGESVRGEKRG